jgi:hypothetical protein
MGIRDPLQQFIHNAGTNPPDQVGDCIFDQQCHSGGAAYAPYLYDVKVVDRIAILRYTLSTWNPYQVMLMKHMIPLAELDHL